jgi:NAD-dependent deacetylase
MDFHDDLKSGVARLEAMIAAASSVVPFTGAGLSTECGIPDFRSPGGLWTQNRPIPFDRFVADPAMRTEAWRRRFAMQEVFDAARPGRGHVALARLVESGRAPAIITQNIDNLHQHSGVEGERIVEIHGNTTYATCLACGTRHELDWIRPRFVAEGEPPPCVDCGGILKTATVSFGQPMPADAMRRAVALARACNLFIAIGSSLVVYPAAGLPALAKENGARLVIINRDPTPFDAAADLVLRGDIGDILEQVK